MTSSAEGSKTRFTLAETVDDYRPLAFDRAGGTVWTSEGKFLELAGGSHASCIVHDEGELKRRLLRRFSVEPLPLLSRALAGAAQLELAERVVTDWGDLRARAYFVSGGTEGIETAIRLAHHIQRQRGRPEATKCIGRQLSYHGMSQMARALGDHPVHGRLGALDPHWPKIPEPRCSDCPLSLHRDTCGLACADLLDDAIQDAGSETVSAHVFEPVGGTTAGAVLPPVGYLERIREICAHHSVLLIADETITAFWRTGRALRTPSGAADIVVGGKCLAAGLAPICAVLVAGNLVDELRRDGAALPLRLTFAGNPLACAAAAVVQDYVQETGLGDHVARNGTLIYNLLADRLPVGKDIQIHGTGHLWSVSVRCKSLEEANRHLASARRRANEAAVEFMGGARSSHEYGWFHVMISPAFDCTEEEILACVEAVRYLTSR